MRKRETKQFSKRTIFSSFPLVLISSYLPASFLVLGGINVKKGIVKGRVLRKEFHINTLMKIESMAHNSMNNSTDYNSVLMNKIK